MKNAKVTLDLLLNDNDFKSSIDDAISSTAKFAAGFASLSVGTGILTDIGSAAVDMGLDFEDTFAKVSTLFGDVSVDTDGLKDKILDLSTTSGIAATDLNEGLYSALSAGIPVTTDMNDAMDFLTQATKLSTAGFTDIQSAVDVATTVLNAYGLSSDQTNRVMNTLIETQNAGKTTVDELASSMGQAIPGAAALGVNFEELSSAMAVLTANGINTAEATTKISALFEEMNDTGSDVNKTFEKLNGESIAEFLEQGGSLQEVLTTLNDYLEDNNKNWGDILSSSESVTAAQTLMKDGGDKLSDTYKRLTDDTHELDDAYEKMQTPQQNLKKIQEGLNEQFINLGTAILDHAAPAIQWISDHMDILGPIIVAVSVAVGVLAVVFGIAAIAAGILNLGLIPLIASFIVAAAPILLIVVGVGLLIYAFYKAAKATGHLQEVLTIFGQIATVVFLVVGIVLKILAFVFGWVFKIIAFIIATFLEHFGPQMEEIIKHLSKVIEFLEAVFEGRWDDAFQILKESVQGFLDWFGEHFPTLNAIFGDTIQLFEDLIHGDWAAAWADLKKIGVDALEGLKKQFPNLYNYFKDFVDLWTAVVNGDWEAAWTALKHIPVDALNAVISALTSALNRMSNTVNSWANSAASVANKIPGVNITPAQVPIVTAPKIPYFANGGIVNGAGLGVIGEAGPEMILPLNGQGAKFLQSAMDLQNVKGSQNIYFNMTIDGDMVASNPEELRADILDDVDSFLGNKLKGVKGV